MPAIREEVQGELWLRPSPRITLFELQRLISARSLLSTPRLGVRDATHPTKGYTPGQQVMLRLYDAKGEQQRSVRVVIAAVAVRRLGEVTPADLVGCEPTLRTWQDVQTVLSHFEGHEVPPDAPVTLVSFDYPEG